MPRTCASRRSRSTRSTRSSRAWPRDLIAPTRIEELLELAVAVTRCAEVLDVRLPARRARRLGPVAHHRHALDHALSFEVVQHVVLRAPVVPHRDRAGRPVVPDGEARALD